MVTANKQLLSRHGPELLQAAEAAGAELRFEASACAAIPVIKVLREALLVAEITRSRGSSTAPPTSSSPRCPAAGCSYGEALARAQALGYAEADPTEDVNGADAAPRWRSSRIAFHTRVTSTTCPTRDRPLQAEDLGHARSLGFVVKLVGVARLLNGSVSVRVYPALVPRGHRLAAVGGPDNAVLLESRATREIMLVGPGAGGDETASAVRGGHPLDPRHPSGLLPAQRPRRRRPHHRPARPGGVGLLRADGGADRPGVLARVAAVFGDAELSIRTVVQSGAGEQARLVLVLHSGPEARMAQALERIRALDEVSESP